MRLLSTKAALAAACLLAACTQPVAAPQSNADPMGPMPVVAGFYDSGPIQREAEWLDVWFTQELAAAIEANAAGPEASRLDFDFRSWANDPEVEDVRYGVGTHSDANQAEISTRFTYEGVPGGMNLYWHMCLRDDGQWRIEDVTAIDVPDEGQELAPGQGEEVRLRALLGLEPEGACT